MKGFSQFFFTILGVTVASCVLNSVMVWLHLAPVIQPYKVGTSVNEPKTGGAEPPQRGDIMIPEMSIADDKDRTPTGFTTAVSDQAPETKERSEYPMSF